MGGVAKALLRRGERTFLACIADTARAVGLADAVVVVGPPHGDAVAATARALGLRVATNPRPDRGMASSVAIGFAALADSELADSELEAAWLWPVDHPDVAVASLRALVAALGDRECARPVVAGRGGHPPLVARAVWPRLVAAVNAPGGARAVLAGSDRVDVALDDAGCVVDVDTPEPA
jgi:molybdenum cofactor cytidylyltransferase